MSWSNLATVTATVFPQPGGSSIVNLAITSLTYDDLSPINQVAMISRVTITNPAGAISLLGILDRDMNDMAGLWNGVAPASWDGYVERTASPGGVVWSNTTGIYDARSLADPQVDALRMRTSVVAGAPFDKLYAFNYATGEVNFALNAAAWTTGSMLVELRFDYVGGSSAPNPVYIDVQFTV